MFTFVKRTQIPVKINNRNPRLASYILDQYGGPDGELGASLRYLSQRFAQTDKMGIALLTDIGVSVSVYDILFALQVHSKRLCYHYSFRVF